TTAALASIVNPRRIWPQKRYSTSRGIRFHNLRAPTYNTSINYRCCNHPLNRRQFLPHNLALAVHEAAELSVRGCRTSPPATARLLLSEDLEGFTGEHHRTGDQYDRAGGDVDGSARFGQVHGHRDGIGQARLHVHHVLVEDVPGDLGQVVRVHGPHRGGLGDHHLIEQRFEL